ncbi:hypothetical protein PAHAL_9G384000 [Panicum hallii]|jgi:hypothetical protein|uniref:DUF4408 domain-containing protein n=1 Tax=Panicum hallii TaxID=206008 RepID=A0A2S3INM4_9POAL|nr:protein ENL [Panicum hallii]PAN48468.1 hypothetical protein PAHAL_9G384000 [Panicum hallii]
MAAQQQAAAASVLQSFPFRAAVLALCVALLPLLPAAPEAGTGEAGQAFLAKACELLHLLFIGIAVSYGLFSRKNTADDGRAGHAAAEKDAAAGPEPAKADARYAWRMFRDSIAPFDDEEDDEVLPDSPSGGGGGREKMRSWSALHRPEDPVVVVSNGGGGRNGHAADAQAPLSLPVRTLKPQSAQDASAGGGETPRSRSRRGSQDPATGGARDETVLPSPIPWRSRSGRLDAGRPASPSPSPSPKRLSPASSLARETLAKASEEEYYAKRRSPYRSSSISSPPPAPPPPPPPFLVHGYHPAAERRAAVGKSFKEELQHHSMRGRGEDHYSPNTGVFSTSAYSSNNSSTAKPRNSFDGGGGSSSSASVGKSVRTIRAREPAAFQGQSQELPDDAGDGRDAVGMHGLEESYGYRAYQSIPRFQYERSVSDPILGGVAVSSDDTESSDDDDVGAYSTRTNSPRESTPEVDENEVDKKAEEFIARFREQIRRQRIESIKKSAGPRGVKHHAK